MRKSFTNSLTSSRTVMSLQSKRGFTLIELLTVIAIIGILATIVQVSLVSSRKKASDSTIKSQLKNARLQAEVYKEYNNGSYAGVCADADFLTLYDGAMHAYDKTKTDADRVCNVNGTTAWAAYVPLKNQPTGFGWCVDSAGNEEVRATLGAGTYACH